MVRYYLNEDCIVTNDLSLSEIHFWNVHVGSIFATSCTADKMIDFDDGLVLNKMIDEKFVLFDSKFLN